MNLRSIDLNLLVVLDALLDEAHVSRAADRLGLSQPAASQALDRCRVLFKDQLLVRSKGLMRRTPKADAVREPLKALLAGARALVAPPEIDIATVRRRVRIIMADLAATIIVGALHARLRHSAPGIDLVVQPWRGAAGALDNLARGDSDLAVSVLSKLDPAFERIDLLDERYVVLMRKGHPAARTLTLDKWLAWPHILVSARGEASGPLDETLASMGRHRRIGLVVPSFLIVPSLVAQSDMIAMLPSRCVPTDAKRRFEVRSPPIPVDGFPLHLAWHRRMNHDPVVRHVADQLRAAMVS